MKKMQVTGRKEGTWARCVLSYRWTHFPESVEWEGNRGDFRLSGGRTVNPSTSLESVEEKVAFQAAQCGAEFAIEDLGGEAVMWMDWCETADDSPRPWEGEETKERGWRKWLRRWWGPEE